MKLGQSRLQHGWIFLFGVICFVGLGAASSQARVLDSTNGPRITVGPSGHSFTKEELAKKNSRKPEAEKNEKTTASDSGQKESGGKE